ncbi:MAG: replicative DNA helicase [Bacteroidetes bacterium HGW-Bacteroidetes-1]|jgi:replicative DNA helicase|nr:MAG: replicative DNA helicase [Bacteroidetes bacterium HGW-Bacteroidetes-1]
MEKSTRKPKNNFAISPNDQQRDLLLQHGRVPPQATDLEDVVLGAMMLEKDAVNAVIDILQPGVFYKEAHQKIFEAIQNLFTKSEPIDILTVTNELRLAGHLEIVGGPYYISQLTNRVVSAANIEFHARIILQKHIQRELIRISSDIIKDAYEDTTDVFDLLDKAESGLFSVSETNLRRSFSTMPDLVQAAIKDIENAKNNESNLRGVPSGYSELDRITQGWQKSDLIILAARPSMGKTALALNLARNAAVTYNRPVAFFSLEMSSVQLVTRLISSESFLPAEKLRKGDLKHYEWQQLTTKITPLVNAKMFIDDTPQLSIFELRAKCRRLKQQHDIHMVFVDYLQLMTSGGENRGNREQEISNISRSLKSLAKELDIPVLALSQLSRSVESRPGSKKPILSDLRESGAIEQDADMVIFIYRPEYYGLTEDGENNNTQGLAVINIAKHRNGKLGDVNLKFVGQFARFDEPDNFEKKPADIAPNEGFETRIMSSRMNDDFDSSSENDVTPF